MLKYIPFFGWAGLVFGTLTAIFAWPTLPYLHLAMLTMIPGLFFSSMYVMLTTKHEVATPAVNPGFVGMLLSSAPLIMFIYFALTH